MSKNKESFDKFFKLDNNALLKLSDEDPLMLPEEEKPNVKQAEEFGKAKKVKFEGTAKESFSAPISVVGNLGVGIELYFRLIKFLALMFCILTLVNIPV